MSVGYPQPLYLLPFDHRESYVSGLFDYAPPLTPEEHAKVAESKQVIYEGFRQTLAGDVKMPDAGILVDERFGSAILRDATTRGYVTAMSTEKSGSDEFEFEYGGAFAEHIEAFDPTFAKVLVRYNPEGDAQVNQRQAARLAQLSEYCRKTGRRFMFELLVPPTASQIDRVRNRADGYDQALRPGLMVQAIRALQDAGVEPDVWKLEGLDRRDDCERIVETARRNGRRDVGCIVLGRGADEKTVAVWLEIAASVPGYTGFAVGRTTFWDAVADWLAGRATRAEAVATIARRYSTWVSIFERARDSRATGSGAPARDAAEQRRSQ
jgi:myo-inositol catabolism protein IolC